METSRSKLPAWPEYVAYELILYSVELPALTQVQGAFNMQTSGKFDCSAFDKLNQNKVIRGSYTCSGSETKPGTAGSKPSGTSSGSSPSGTGAAGQFQVDLPAVLGATSVMAGLLQFIL